MQRIKGAFFLVAVLALTFTATAEAANRVRVESTVMLPNTKDTVGIFIDNDVPVGAIVLAMEIRTVTGGAFIGVTADSAVTRAYNTAGRLHNSPLGNNNPNGPAAGITQSFFKVPTDTGAQCGGPGSSRWRFATTAKSDLVSPDAFLLACFSQGDPGIGEDVELAPGADPAGVPSYRVIFTTNASLGFFEIDTCCIQPANHLVYTDVSANEILPSFVKGEIIIDQDGAVKELETGVIPQDYSLEQNYPNPFNAGTVIRFAQPVDGNVKIDVYNILGRKVKTLVDEFRSAGTHQTDWDGRSDDGVQVSTGVYFYRIMTDSFSSTRKMVLLK